MINPTPEIAVSKIKIGQLSARILRKPTGLRPDCAQDSSCLHLSFSVQRAPIEKFWRQLLLLFFDLRFDARRVVAQLGHLSGQGKQCDVPSDWGGCGAAATSVFHHNRNGNFGIVMGA